MEYLDLLKNLGLNDKEATVYFSLLQLSQPTAYLIAQKSGLKKPTTYVILDSLIKKGFAVKLPYSTKQLYSAISPNKCLEKTKERLQETEKIMPQLMALNKEEEKKVNVQYFEGAEEIKQMYRQMLKTAQNKEILAFAGHTRNTPKTLNDYWEEFNLERIKRNITVRGFTSDDPTTKKWTKDQKKLLFNVIPLPLEEYDSNVSIEIFNNIVQIVSFRYLQGIRIENTDICHSLKQIFNMLWKNKN